MNAIPGLAILIDEIEVDAKAVLRRCAEMRQAAEVGDLVAANEAALDARKHLRNAEPLAIASQCWISRHRRRQPKVR